MISADPRATMRDALRRLMQSDPPEWDDESLRRFRNRLLDETGSDARPLAELLLEAVRRGLRDQLPQEPLDSARWDALSAAFAMRWSAERFLQPEMARWAAETWGYALDVIRADQLRIAVPPPIAPVTAKPAPAAPAPVVAAAPAKGRGVTPSRSPAYAPPKAAAARGVTRSVSRAVSTSRSTPQNRATSAPSLSPRIAYAIAGCAAASYVIFLGRMMVAVTLDRRATPTPVAAAAAAAPASAVVPALPPIAQTDSTLPPAVESLRPPPAVAAARVQPDAPRLDSSRMVLVEPVRRAAGAPVAPAATGLTPSARAPLTFDELQFTDGRRMIGRVDIVRSGTVVFRDMKTGLRHEVRKDSIAQIITEFGTPVRFRAAGSPPRDERLAATARATVRSKGVAGPYTIRYGVAKPVGSRECVSVWSRPPQAVDRLSVQHIPDADTLLVSIDGGENYPSNIDAEGFFASTPRVLPEQARTSTAMITRLSGRFSANGSLSLTVSIVFFRRMRVGADVSCTVTVDATGERRP